MLAAAAARAAARRPLVLVRLAARRPRPLRPPPPIAARPRKAEQGRTGSLHELVLAIELDDRRAVSYTHLTLPTIYSV